jgi:hypothetical protein
MQRFHHLHTYNSYFHTVRPASRTRLNMKKKEVRSIGLQVQDPQESTLSHVDSIIMDISLLLLERAYVQGLFKRRRGLSSMSTLWKEESCRHSRANAGLETRAVDPPAMIECGILWRLAAEASCLTNTLSCHIHALEGGKLSTRESCL